MREKVRDRGRLEHILQACNNILANKDKYVFEEIKDDPIIFYGFVKQVEIIGEAVYMLTKEFREEHHAVEACAWLLHDRPEAIVGSDRG